MRWNRQKIKTKTPAPGDYVVSSKKPGKGKKLAKDKKVKADKTAFISVDIHKNGYAYGSDR